MTLAGKVIDVFDDVSGEVLRSIPIGDIPDMAKTASVDPAQIAELPDASFAVVMLTKEAQKIRKYPLHDPGNAWLSSEFFDRTHEAMPKHAAVVAAKNIKHACDAYDIKCSSMISKLASIADTDDNMVDLTFEFDDMVVERKLQDYHMRKVASLSGRAKEIFDGTVSGMTEKTASEITYGLSKTVSAPAYPLRNRREVKVASEYLVENLERFKPLERVEFSKNIMKVAADLGIETLPHDVRLYGSDTYNPWLHGEMIKRAEHLDENGVELLHRLEEKTSELKPDEFAAALYELEKDAGVDQLYDDTICDPFSVVKIAEDTSKKKGVIVTHEDESFNSDDLASPEVQKKLSKYFRGKLTKALVNHPVETFNGLAPQLKGVVIGIVKGRM